MVFGDLHLRILVDGYVQMPEGDLCFGYSSTPGACAAALRKEVLNETLPEEPDLVCLIAPGNNLSKNTIQQAGKEFASLIRSAQGRWNKDVTGGNVCRILDVDVVCYPKADRPVVSMRFMKSVYSWEHSPVTDSPRQVSNIRALKECLSVLELQFTEFREHTEHKLATLSQASPSEQLRDEVHRLKTEHRAEVQELRAAMRELEEDNQAMKTELRRLKEELTRTAHHREQEYHRVAASMNVSPPGHAPTTELPISRSDARDPHAPCIPPRPRSTAMLQPCLVSQETPPARS
ncbi:UNVERIFIED_CONTAM: hypothetical protein FKN15_049869 [Acipenser sinensis]